MLLSDGHEVQQCREGCPLGAIVHRYTIYVHVYSSHLESPEVPIPTS